NFFPELIKQSELIAKVICEEEDNFLRTLVNGIQRLSEYITDKKGVIPGELAFELYDTYGFPIDLTELMAREKGRQVDMKGFEQCLAEQKARSKKTVSVAEGEWVTQMQDDVEEFVGYDYSETNVQITRYRQVEVKGKELYHLVFNITPFYAEGGGQVGDTGIIQSGDEKVKILNTFREHQLIIHLAERLPANPEAIFIARVDKMRRKHIACNHSATHLLHRALRESLGAHVEQKGSLVSDTHLRFDFVHYTKMSDEELRMVEEKVNEQIRANQEREEKRNTPYEQALNMGAIALFGEKYSDLVRVIRFGDSVELCGGIHVENTGQIGLFKIVSESAVAAGIRRIEAITATKAQEYIDNKLQEVVDIRKMLKNPKDIRKALKDLLAENAAMRKQIEVAQQSGLSKLKQELLDKKSEINGIAIISEKVDLNSDAMRSLAFQLRKESENLFLVLGAQTGGKAIITVAISDKLVEEKGIKANEIIHELAKEINGGGGGQPFFATAGGDKPGGLDSALKKAISLLE
ncbi:MAG: alanine--tRNA ligase-related protein, partial [Flavobacteriales bacterium]